MPPPRAGSAPSNPPAAPRVHPPTAGRPAQPAPRALLLALPHGFNVSGITLWAARLATALAERGGHVGILAHPEPAGQARLDLALHPAVEVVAPPGLPPIESARGDLSPFIPHYLALARRLAARSGGPVILSPNNHGDCYGVAAAVCVGEPELVRVIGIQHSDIEYDGRLLAHYEPIIAKFIGVSRHIADSLRARQGIRAGDVVHLPYGVTAPADLPRREPLGGRPVRLIYTGRMEHAQKRITALARLSDELVRRGVRHELLFVGDGPAAAEIDRAAGERPSLRRIPAAPPATVSRLLAASDLFVLASRYEGLSVSLLEAMAQGCVPVITRTESGAGEAIDPGVHGMLVDVSPDMSDAEIAVALADGIEAAMARGVAGLAAAAWASVRERFSLDRHASRYAAILSELVATPPRPWPASRPCAFSAAEGAAGSGSVPPDGAARLRALLERLAGRRVVVHGVGQHTRQLAHVLAESSAEIAGFTDDDPARAGGRLWNWPIVAPADAGALGATDAVISSWMHHEAIWTRRAVYQQQGIRVHRLYGETP